MNRIQLRFAKPNQNLDRIVDDQPIELFDPKAMKRVTVSPRDSQGLCFPLDANPATPDMFDDEWVKLGYAWCMKRDPETEAVLMKMPKKDQQIRNYFNYNKAKCSYWDQYDFNKMDTKQVDAKKDIPGTYKTEKVKCISRKPPADKLNSFLRGVMSACGCINLKHKFISFPLDVMFSTRVTEDIDPDYEYIADGLIDSYEHNSSRAFVSNPDNVRYWYQNIGFVQDDKMAEFQLLMLSKNPKMLKPRLVTPDGKITSINSGVKKPKRAGERTLEKFQLACQHGDLETAKQLHEKYNMTPENARANYNKAFRWAIKNGHLAITMWLKETYDLTLQDVRGYTSDAFYDACRNGQLEMLKWLHDTYDLTPNTPELIREYNFAYRCAEEKEQKHVTDWLTKTFGITEKNEVVTKKVARR